MRNFVRMDDAGEGKKKVLQQEKLIVNVCTLVIFLCSSGNYLGTKNTEYISDIAKIYGHFRANFTKIVL